MRVEFGVTENAKKKLVRRTWAGHVERMGDKNKTGKENRCLESGREMETRKTEIALKVT